MTTNVMIDIETLGLDPNCVVLSIGAVTDTGDEFYVELDVNDQGGRTVNLDTVKWWMTQPIKPPMNGVIMLSTAVAMLDEWLSKYSDVQVWANGTDFDITILSTVYKQFGFKLPWKYNAVRDYRTLSKMFPRVPRPPFQGDKHNALADAKHQMEHLKEILAHIIRMERSYVAASEG